MRAFLLLLISHLIDKRSIRRRRYGTKLWSRCFADPLRLTAMERVKVRVRVRVRLKVRVAMSRRWRRWRARHHPLGCMPRSTSVFLLPLTAQSLDTETDDAFTISHSVIFLREVLSLYWDSLLFRGGSDFSLRIDRKPVAFIGAGRLVAAVRV